MSDTPQKSSKSFWIVFAVIIGFAAFSTIGNLLEYRTVDRIGSEGIRIQAAVTTIVDKGSKQEIVATYIVDGKSYTVSKKVKNKVALNDSVSVYYLADKPAVSAIAAE